VTPPSHPLASLPPGWRTRFAPAPTGFLHLGHAVNAIYVWGLARAYDGQVILRIEDHDGTRSRPEYERGILDDLDWLGLAPDLGATAEFRTGAHQQRQSDNGTRYEAALAKLDRASRVYACDCSRRDIAQEVPDVFGEEMRYSGRCRERGVNRDTARARRVIMVPGAERFDDLRLGLQEQEPAVQCGDVLVRNRLGQWTYQFAVVVDDMEQGVDVVIRGEDLLPSTGRQVRLGRLLGRDTPPAFIHHPLILKPDGSKLSKSAGDTGIRELRDAGLGPAAVLGRAAALSGLISQPRPLDVAELASLFRPATIPSSP
jgi:glutamyl-tRNA synthetase/glutamyl-Q tRNA(Asp) synthetase